MSYSVPRRRLVRIHFTDRSAPSIEGVIISRPGRYWQIRQASVLETSDRSFSIDGDVFIPRENVLWVQVVG